MSKAIFPEDLRTPREKRLYPYTMHDFRGFWAIFFEGNAHGVMIKRSPDRMADEEAKEKLLGYMNQLNLDHAEAVGDPRETAALQARMRELHKQRTKAETY